MRLGRRPPPGPDGTADSEPQEASRAFVCGHHEAGESDYVNVAVMRDEVDSLHSIRTKGAGSGSPRPYPIAVTTTNVTPQRSLGAPPRPTGRASGRAAQGGTPDRVKEEVTP